MISSSHMGFEGAQNLDRTSNLESIEAPVFKSEHEAYVMSKAYEKAIGILERESIKPEQFSETYSEALLTKCANYVTNCERKFEERRESDIAWKRAEIFGKTLEALLHDQINQGIYGDDVRGVSTAPYDDYYAGIDEVLERQDENGSTYIGCALDFTFGHPEKKMEKIVQSIEAGLLHDVIFYESPFGNPPHVHGKLQGMPKIVVGMDAEHLTELSELWIGDEQERIQDSHLLLMILRQIEQQSEVYEIIAKRHHKNEVAARYRQVYNSVLKLYKEIKERKNIVMLDSEALSDKVNVGIKNELARMLNL